MVVAALALAATVLPQAETTEPRSVPPVPTAAQLGWQRMETNAFVHFGPNTFTSVEWGTGRENPAIFNPTAFDAGQWVRTFKDAGFRGVIITAKHHDGYCLWPSALSTHTVARSPWRGGHGDVLRDLSDACRTAGLKFGVYLSPWDRNHPAYGTPEYNRVFAAMLEEVLGHYGPVFEVWFDGANGEGPNGKRQVYDWPHFVSTVRRLQPGAVIFSDAGPDVRWVGNERGEGGTTSWSLINRSRYVPGTELSHELTQGVRDGPDWVPPECDVSIRPGWFYRSSEDDRVKTANDLASLYESSVGRNCQLLLNVPPDHRGLIADADVKALAGMRRLLDDRYRDNLAAAGHVASQDGRPESSGIAPLVDGNTDTSWRPAGDSAAPELTIVLPRASRIDRIVLQEPIARGQRVARFRIDARVNGSWATVAEGTTIGHKRILPIDPVTTDRVRVTIVDSRAVPLLAEIGLYSSRRQPSQ
jgi:alpha-L-fucosidase